MEPCMRLRRLAGLLGAGLALAGLAGCAAPNPMLADLDELMAQESRAAEESAPLGGTALAQRKRELQRTFHDLVHFHTTLENLREHRDRPGLVVFSQFLDAYMGLHLDPLLANQWQSRHPELMALDANLRLAKADVLIRMRAPGRAEEVIEEIETLFEGRGEMLVEYPIGSQGTLAHSLELLRDRKWWRG
jgi:hypothetical protein